ncbi:MAG: hypothetical protein KIH64_009415 [Mycobacterium sp.]|nr:hypothetical protein [Mycobacterium sp.]
MQITELTTELAEQEAAQDYSAVIAGVRELLTADPHAIKDPWVKGWIARRWRNLFIQEAIKDSKAVDYASKPLLLSGLPLPGLLKKSNPRQAIAERFLKDAPISEWQAEMPAAQHDPIENTTLIICGGLLTGLLHSDAHAFPVEAERLFAERGWRYLRADIHPMRSCEANEADIEAAFRGEGLDAKGKPSAELEKPDKVFLLGYSKGTPDILSFLVHHPEYHDRIKGVFTWAGAAGGSYTADGIYSQIKDLPIEDSYEYLSTLLSVISGAMLNKVGVRRLDEYDVKGAINDLRTEVREAFNRKHASYLDGLGIPLFALTGATTPLEVPNVQFMDAVRLSSHDANNDMQLTQKQALVPIGMNTHLAMAHAHHWDVAYAPFPAAMRVLTPNLEHHWPRYAALVANWELMAELGLID